MEPTPTVKAGERTRVETRERTQKETPYERELDQTTQRAQAAVSPNCEPLETTQTKRITK